MFPIALTLTDLKIALIGQGDALVKRKKQLLEQQPSPRFLEVFDQVIPDESVLQNYHLILVVGLDETQSAFIASIARKHKILVNVEDNIPYCDFYFCSFFERGDLMISVSTNGKSPTLGKRIKEKLMDWFSPVWSKRVEELAEQRLAWRAEGASYTDVIAKSNAYIDQKGWFHG